MTAHSKRKKVPRVALCGRRNVGKSTLFNSLLGKKRAITDSFAGLTRDVLEAEIERDGFHFFLSDTPGLDLDKPDPLEKAALEKARERLQEADLIIHLMEPPAPAPYDLSLEEMLRQLSAPIIQAVNKIDGEEREDEILAEFYQEGMNPLPISARGRRNLRKLLNRMNEVLPKISRPQTSEPQAVKQENEVIQENEEPVQEEDPLRSKERKNRRSTAISDLETADLNIAIVGRPNSGKSSLLNRLTGKELALVSDIAGTTRDTLDASFSFQGKRIRIIDTAGLRRSSYLRGKDREVDFYSVSRAQRAIRDCQVVIHLLDAEKGITDFDKKILATVVEYGKAAVLGINKWDAYPDKDKHSTRDFLDRLNFLFPQGRRFPAVFCSALTGQRVFKLMEICLNLNERLNLRVATARLNSLTEEWNHRLRDQGSQGKIYYAVQASGPPPTFLFFVNNKKHFRAEHSGYVENRLREQYGFDGVPVTIILKNRKDG